MHGLRQEPKELKGRVAVRSQHVLLTLDRLRPADAGADRIGALQKKKATYEEILRRRLDDLEQDYRMLQMQGQELAVRNCKGQIAIPMAA